MSINYSIAMLGNPIDEDAPKKAYAKSQYTNILTLDKFAGHIASHGSKYNRADIYAVLMQTVDCMREMLLEGKRLEMGDLGVFSISIQSRGGGKPGNLQPRHTHRTAQRELDSRRPVPKLTRGRRVQPRALAPCRQNPAEEHQGGRDHRGPDGRRRRRQRSQPAHRRTGVTRPGRTACPSR